MTGAPATPATWPDSFIVSFETDVPYTHEAWRGRIRASAGMAASLLPEKVAAFDAEHAALLARDFPADPLAVPHRCWAVWGRKS